MLNNSKYNRQNFLLTFFDDKDSYQEKMINGFWLVKQFNGNTKSWQVAIFTKKSYKNYKNFNEQLKLSREKSCGVIDLRGKPELLLKFLEKI